MVVTKAAETLGLPVPRMETKTEFLQPSAKGSEPLLAFNETLHDILLGTWPKPSTGLPISRHISRRHRPAPGDPVFLTNQPTPERLVVQSSMVRMQSGAFPNVPLDRESKKLEAFGKRIFTSSSSALRSVNTSCYLGHYSHTYGTWWPASFPMSLTSCNRLLSNVSRRDETHLNSR
mgnify:CR=1 FL=1